MAAITLTYDEYLDLIPEETKKYVELLICYLYSNSDFTAEHHDISRRDDKAFFKTITTYQDISFDNKRFLSQIGFDTDSKPTKYDISGLTAEGIFKDYIDIFMPFDDIENYVSLMPEDIIRTAYIPNGNTCYLIHNDDESFLTELNNRAKEKKIALREEYFKDMYSSAPIAVVNYFDTAAKIYEYLSNKKDYIKHLEPTTENIKAISYVLAIFYYKHISQYGEEYNEQKIMVDYFKSIGLTASEIEKAICVNVPINIFNNKANIGILKTKLDVKLIKDFEDEDEECSVNNIFYNLIESSDDLGFRRLFSLCNLTIGNVEKYNLIVEQKYDEFRKGTYGTIYDNDLMPSVVKLIHRVNQIYTYLVSKIDSLDKLYVNTDNDLLALALFLTAYDTNYPRMQFFIDHGITLDRVLHLVGLPDVNKYQEELEKTKENENFANKLKYLVYEGNCIDIDKSNITEKMIFSNLEDKDYLGSSIIHKLYSVCGLRQLPDYYSDEINEYFREKDRLAKYRLQEEIFDNLSMEVYEFLCVVSNYYETLKETDLSQVDKEQLSIILAVSRFDSRMENYLDSLSLSRENLAELFNTDWSYEEHDLNIDAIDTIFRKYIFDRNESEITVHTIFQNAFDPKLTNTIALREALHKVGRKPEDFMDIDAKLEAYDKKVKEEYEEARLVDAYGDICEDAIETNRSVLVVYDYLKNNIKNESLLSSDSDYKEMAMLIVVLKTNDRYAKYFEMYHITLEYVLSLLGLNLGDLDNILKNKCKNELIYEFDYYYEYPVHKDDYIRYIFEDGNVVRKLAILLGEEYSKIENSVLNEEEKELTSEERIEMLKSFKVLPVDMNSISSIAAYGNELSEHTTMINGSLNALMQSDSVEKSVKSINEALQGTIVEVPAPVKKKGFFENIFVLDEPTKVIKTYDDKKLEGLVQKINPQISILIGELQDYENIRKQIEVYLYKLNLQLEELEKKYQELNVQFDNLDDIGNFTSALNQKTRKEILYSKITTVKTTIAMMKQELISVHRAIINHFITINALQSTNAIIPILNSELAIYKGNQSEAQALETVNSLFGLAQGVINKNVELTQTNLLKLQSSSLPINAYESLSKEISQYIDTVNRTNELLEEPKRETIESENEQDDSPYKLKRVFEDDTIE